MALFPDTRKERYGWWELHHHARGAFLDEHQIPSNGRVPTPSVSSAPVQFLLRRSSSCRPEPRLVPKSVAESLV